MAIAWNKVTWYSITLAVLVFLAVFAVAFELGREYESLKTAEMVQAVVDTTQANMLIHTHASSTPTKSSTVQTQ